MSQSKYLGALALAVLAAAAAPAAGQSANPAQENLTTREAKYAGDQPTEKSMDQMIEDIKHPFQGFSWGADQRLRQEYFNNAITLNGHAAGHEFDFGRYRSRVWMTYSPVDFLEVNARLLWEWWAWEAPRTKETPAWNQAEFDTFNFKLKFPALNASLTVGRQDIALGDGWVVLEGTPLDGSTSIYFDALRYNMQIKDIQTTVDAIYINQYSDPDQWLPTMGDTDHPQIEQDERGVVLYGSNQSIPGTTLDGYFIYKHDHKVLVNGDDGDIYAAGSRVEHFFSPNLKGRVEGLYECGSKNDRQLSAFGATGRLTYMFKDSMDNQLFLAGEELSGSGGSTGRDTQFDPLWGRWPQWSELYIYTYAGETRIAETTNLQRVGPGYEVHPVKPLCIQAAYYALFANTSPLSGIRAGFGEGLFRGNLFTSNLKYQFNKHLTGGLVAECLLPGDYNTGASNDTAVYLRAELILTF